MSRMNLKVWNTRVRRTLVVALIAPLFTAITAVSPQPAYAATIAASDGSCVQDVGSTTGVTVTRSGNDCIVVFTSLTSTTWKAPAGITLVRYLVVGGGASGDRGNCGTYWGRGGGGGQVRDSTLSVTGGTNYTVVVGKGGDASAVGCPNVGGNNGVASQFGSITSSPGLGGQANTGRGGSSGSGQIGGLGDTGALGGGGGGGAGVGGSGKNGGAGVNSDITGSTIMYGSGGAGRDNNGAGTASSGAATGNAEATANRGGGGADYGSGWYAGAAGVVVVRYTDRFIVTFDSNGAISGSPSVSSLTQSAKDAAVTLASRGTLTKGALTFAGWNTQTDGKGTFYAASSAFTPTANVTLYAQWNSVISYDRNTATTTRAIESTTATSNQAATTLSSGRLVRGNPIASGLILNLDAADSSTVSGTTWTNKVSGGTSATIVGSPTYSPTEGAFTLNGSSQYFNLGNTAFNFSGTQNYTINVAFRNNEPMKYASVFSRYNGGVAGNYHVTFDSGKYQVSREVSPWAVNSNSDVDPGRINYVSAVYDGSRLAVFVNGVSDGSIAMTGSVGNNSINTLIGARLTSNSPTSYLNGKIYSVQVYNRALSASEIATNFQELIPEARVSKTNFTLVPWNTSSAGTGTALGSTVTDLSALPTPYLRLQPSNYNAGAKTWSSTPGSSSFTYRGTPEFIASNNGKFGATGNFPVIGGTTSASIYLENPTLTTYTLCVVARYRGLAASPGTVASQGRLINGKSENWISGYYGGGVSQFHHNNGWNYYNGSNTDLNWHYHCDSGNKAYWDGVKLAPWTNQTTTYMPSLGINAGWAGAEFSDWEVADLIIYDQFLPESQIEQINRYFKNTYGILAGPSSTAAAVSVSPSTTYASSGDATLYANWGSAITYDGNKQTSGTAPSPSLITGASGNLASNSGSLFRAGFRFDGWNTNEAGTGTTYAAGSSYPNTGNITLYAKWSLKTIFPTSTSLVDPTNLSPYMRYKGSDYDASTKTWRDSSGNGRNTSLVEGTPTVVATTANTNGSTKAIQVLQGVQADKIRFENPTTTGGNYTLFSLIRYNTTDTTKQGRILNSIDNTWFTGHWNQRAGVAYHENTWTRYDASVTPVTNWVLGTDYTNAYRSNGNQQPLYSTGGANLRPLGINASAEPSNFQVAEIILYDRALTLSEIKQVEDYLASTYGISAHTYAGTYTTSTSLAIGAGVGGRSETLTALNGLGNKIITMSPSRNGITLETTTANSAVVVVSPTAATGVYAQIITATDTTGETSTHTLTITVNPAVKFDTSTATTLITTHRRGATLRLNTVFGVGTKVFTMTSAGTGITLDTSTAASGFATLRVDTFTATGTYTQTITVTDDTRIRSTYTVTITINGPPTISSSSAITTSPTTSGLRLNLDAGDPESYSGSGTTWTDLSGNSRNATWQASPTFSSANGGTFDLNGTTQFASTSSIASDVFTVEVWAKFNALNNNYACLVTNVYTGDKINYAICFWGDSRIRAGYHQAGTGWVGGQTGTFTPVIGTWYQFVYTVGKSGANYIGTLYVNNTAITGTTSSTIAPGSDAAGMRIGRRWDSGEYINGSIPVVRIYNRSLSTAEISQNYNALLPRFSNNPTNSVTITTTESVTASSSIYYAGLGTGNKTFALSNPTAGISIDTATVNTVRLNAANTLTATSTTVARSISQVITATDVNGVSAATPVYVTTIVNPKVIITDATPGTLSTTFGRIAYDTFTATQGTGTKIFTVSSASFASAFVMTNPSTNVGLLTVANNLPAGTYPVTVTATDSVGGITTLALSVVVNPVPTIAGATGNSVTTTLARSTSLRINVTGGTGARTISWTSPNAGITIDSSTITSQNFITLNVSAAVPANTFSFAITAVDSLSARVSDTFTVTVNRWPVIASSSVVQSGLVVNLDASTYSGSGNWLDSSGFGRNAVGATASTTPAGTAPVYSTESGGNFSFNEGAAATNHMLIPNPGTLETFTVSTWVRFKSIPTNNTAIITQYWPGGTNTINYTIGFSGSSIYGAYYRGGSNWTATTSSFTPVINTWYQITYLVSKSGNNYFQDLYVNGVKQGSTVDAGTIAPASNGSVISLGRRWDTASNVIINGAYGNVSIYNRALSAAEILQNYNATGARYVSTNSGSEALTVTQGVAGSLSGVVVSQGTGTKTLALSNTNAGISIDTATANTFSLALANTLTATSTTAARVLTETVTATDAAGATTSRVYTITVNPPVIETATSTSIATTSGVETTTVIYATQGTGNKTFALSGATSGFTLTSGVNQATLRVLSTANPGTYNLTVTATDALGATAALPITVVVSPPPTLLGISRIESTKGVAFTSPVYALSGGTGTLTLSITNSPTNSNITLTGVTSTGGSILVGSASETGTYLSTIRVTDARGSFSELVVTVVVNAPVTLSGSLSITKTYGNSVTSGYSTNGSGTAPFSFSATPICAVVKTVSGSYTYERINGTDSCTWTAPVGVSAIDAFIVGAGGGGGGDGGAGGGGGSINTLSSVTLPANRQVTVQVGSGGSGGVWSGDAGVAGGTTSITSGSTSYTAPGGAAGGGCGSAAALGGSLGSGGSALVGGNSGFGGTGTGCGGGNGSAGSNGPVSNFTGSNVSYGGGGGGGVFPSVPTTVGLNAGGSGGGGTGAASRDFPSLGLTQYFRTKPAGATNGDAFTTGTCADPIVGNINYRSDSYFPCTDKNNFQGYATGYFIAPVSGSIKFYLTSDDASKLTININGTNNELALTPCCTTVNATWSGFVAGQAYPINVYFTEDGGLAQWILEYEYTGFTKNIIPVTQLRSNSEGLAQYFRTTSLEAASTKPTFTTSSSTCMERVGNINYTADSQFPCGADENFQAYATGFFIAPVTGSITFNLTSDDSSYLSINVNGVSNELSRPCCGEASATWSGFVKGQYYPINVYFTENGGLATWKLEYSYTGVSKTAIPAAQLRSTASFTAPVQGTNGLGGGGGGGTAGTFKLSGANGGSGTAILKYLTPSETATQTMITAIVNQVSPSGLLTLNVPEFVNVGTYTETIKVQDAANSPPYQAVVTITINKATPTLALSLPGSVTTAKYGNPVTISAVTATPGRVAFVNGSETITACSAVSTTAGVATCSWTPTAVGSTTLRAQLTPTDTANYNSSALTNLSITVAKADTLTVTVASLTRQYTGSAVSVTGAFTTTGLVAIDSLTAISMLYSGTANTGTSRSATTAPTDAGTYTIAPNFPANANAYTFAVGSAGTTSAVSNYESVTVVAGTLTINRAPQVMTFRYPDTNTVTYSPTGTITPSATTRLDSAVRSYSSSTLTKCTIDSSTAVISIVEAGSCEVSMAVAQTFNYLADTATATVTINKAARTFSLTPVVSTLKYSESTTVTATLSAGASDGTISYTLGSPAGCTFDPLSGELVAISGTVQCPLTATISEGINYRAETATAISLTIARANSPVITIDTVTAMNHTPGIRALVAPSFTVSGLKNSETADSLSFTYSFVSNPFETFTYSDTRTPIDAGTYRITPSALTLSSGLMSNYETPTYSSSAIDFIINRIGQESVTIVTTNGEVEVPFTLQASGGSTNGAVTFTKLSGTSCSVTGNSLSATAAGLCVLTVTRAGNRNYLPFTSESITVMVRNFVIFQVTAPANPVTGITITPTTPIVKGPDVCTSGCVPTLTSADVYDVAEADLIILTGTNLLTVTKVYFNIYTEAPNFTADSDTQLSVRVPADLPQGDATVEVVSPGGTSNRLFDFIILP
jgi:uncharacterized repeat protein (TIGR02543 family)